jgi:hypothetical protein
MSMLALFLLLRLTLAGDNALKMGNPFGSGNAGQEIAKILKRAMEGKIDVKELDLRDIPVVSYARFARDAVHTRLWEPLVGFNRKGKPELSMTKSHRILARFTEHWNSPRRSYACSPGITLIAKKRSDV